MKNIKFSRLATLLVVCALAVCAITGVTASADDAAPAAEIETANVAYNDMVQLAFTITTTEDLPAGSELGIMVWAADTAEFTVHNAKHTTFASSEKDGKVYYKTAGIPAPEMDTAIYVAAVYKADGVITIAETPFRYSALQYAGTRLTEAGITAKQASLYEDLIAYGISSDDIFENAENYAFVKANNGTIGSAGAEIGGWLGKTVLLRAEAKNAAGEYFIKWVDEEGATVSENRLAFVPVTETGITEYTAIFGDKADSAYANTYDFESLTTGDVQITNPNLFSAPGSTAYSKIYYEKCWATTTTLGSLAITSSMAPVTIVIDGTKTLVTDEYGKYSVAVRDKYAITQSLYGDKEMFIDRFICPQGYVNKFTNSVSGVAQAAEFDLTLHNFERSGIANSVTIQIADKNGKTMDVRLNLSCDKNINPPVLTIQDQPSDTNNRHTYTDGSEAYSIGATYTMLTSFNYENGTVDVAVNGVSYGSLPLSNWGTYKSEFVFDEEITIKYISINCESGSGNDLSIDNVTFLAN